MILFTVIWVNVKKEGPFMKILQLDIEGFRSLKKVVWNPGDLNVVIGPNGTGKSNLLRFLELISISAQGRLGKYIQSMGGMEPLVWDGQAPDISFKVKTLPVEENRDPKRDAVTYELKLARLGKGSSYRIKRELLANYFRVETGTQSEPFKFVERDGANGRIFDEHELALVAPEESVTEEETLLSIAANPFTNNRLITLFQQQVSSWAIYHDINVSESAPIRQSTVARAEKRIDPDGQNLISVLHTLYTENRDFKREINQAMLAAFGDDFEELVFPPAADQRIQLRVRWKSLKREQSAADLSDGTLRYLLILTILASPSPAPIIAIDEPETGLHPSMLPIIAEYAAEASTRSQVILTTHSPQLLDAFSEIKPTTTVVKWSGGETTLKTLNGKDLDYWLENYSLGTLFKSGELEEIE
jgi:predicted ATPase